MIPQNEPKEFSLFKITSGLAAGLALGLTTVPGFAQGGPSYESRSYGGPLYIGPNFHQGGQYSAPIYGSPSYRAPSSGEYRRQRSVTRTREATTHKNDKVSEPTPALTKTATTENSSIAVLATREDAKDTKAEAADSSPVNCRKYFPNVGLTVSVPCDNQ
jgi:hypothetical protein